MIRDIPQIVLDAHRGCAAQHEGKPLTMQNKFYCFD